ncbi:hypothetical protein IKQ21_04315 [bacterium]|nr:hypothetical protein [bacterium]
MDLLKIGQKISIFFQKGANIVEMSCNIQKILDDRLVITLPPCFMRYINNLEVGKRLTLKVFSKVGTIDFNGVIISSPLEEDFCVELDYNAMKLTSSTDIPVVAAVETLSINLGESQFNAKTFEIATEYLKFYSDKKFQVNDVLDCALVLPQNYGTIYFKGTVSEIDPVYEGEYTLSDFCMTEDDRQLLLYYMYMYSNDSGWEEE